MSNLKRIVDDWVMTWSTPGRTRDDLAELFSAQCNAATMHDQLSDGRGVAGAESPRPAAGNERATGEGAGTGNGPVRAEDVLPAGVESTTFNGVAVRKGSVGAFVANARAVEGLESGTAAYEELAAELRRAAPALVAVGIFEVFELRSPRLRALLATDGAR